MSTKNVELLLVHADSHQPVTPEGLPAEAAAQAPRDEAREAHEESHLWDDGEDPNSLPAQRWGLVAPEGPEGDRLLALIEPLRQRRQEQQEGHPVRVYRVKQGLAAEARSLEHFSRWVRTVLDDESVPVADRPRYLLFLGDFDQVPFELQQCAASSAFVGRLAFRREQDYEAYVDKVLRWENKPSTEEQARTLFFTVHDGTAATTTGYQSLVAPGIASARQAHELGRFPMRELRELGGPGEPGVGALFEQAARAQPSILFSMSHGLGSPRAGWRNADTRLALQGALNLGEGQHLDGAALANRPFLPGGIWFLFACFGAGTPSRSAFQHWLRQLQAGGQFSGRLDSLTASLPQPGERPFVAALPQAALANPNGPLAVFGHVDLAWTYGFQDRDSRRGKVSRFLEPLQQLARGRRAGLGMGWLMRGFNQANLELTTLYDVEEEARGAGRPSQVEPLQRAHLWMLRQDLSGYVLLGDPAVKLPLAQPALERTLPSSLGLPALSPEAPAPVAPTPPRAPQDAKELEFAVLELASHRLELAQKLGVSPEQLQQWEQLFLEGGRQALVAHLGAKRG
ncbi:hypothetical protein [Cystobacter fuscus]|uniref:hypothetical protein n=1 Tax=Cystobacter fuscus TaxID=43 RepID=UPI002B2D0A22|nr:helix-turn-helix domain-containing protein [Cystobacter fuscus]